MTESKLTRSDTLKRPGAEVLMNGRCVGHTEHDDQRGTVLVIDWHDPAGCEHVGQDHLTTPNAEYVSPFDDEWEDVDEDFPEDCIPICGSSHAHGPNCYPAHIDSSGSAS